MSMFREQEITTDTLDNNRIDADAAADLVVANEMEIGDSELLVEDSVDEAAIDEPLTDSLQLYLNAIGQVPLLTSEEEVSLAQQIERGEQARARLDDESYTSWQERFALERDMAQAKEARQRLIQSNLRLVVSVAKKYRNSPMPLMDLVQEGNIGLMRAVEKFDYHRGYRFSTYATWWIRQAITRAIAQQSRLIRLPVHVAESMMQLNRTIERLKQKSEHDPTPEEIARAMQMSVRKVKHLLNASVIPLSIEQPTNHEGERRIGELLIDEQVQTPLEMVAQNMLQQDLNDALNKLSEREREILRLRYGLADGHRHTLEEAGAIFGITRERARQIEAEAMRRLRNPDLEQRLQGYLEKSG